MNYWIHPEAAEELSEAALYYGTEASKEISLSFLLEFERVRELLIWNQELGSEIEQGMRIFHLQKFPYGVVYCTDDAGPQIYAISHHRRRPGYWKSRV
ncbi:MAG: type II toxin-antitoxin system RelE/ParE family toxin [Gammaproteobacteria bacterium]|nr:MAG: type II toxin-antitoxin system RelE/ParE family toxin [Gammaproteobacteria bacterium]